jgi:hypothetical protein
MSRRLTECRNVPCSNPTRKSSACRRPSGQRAPVFPSSLECMPQRWFTFRRGSSSEIGKKNDTTLNASIQVLPQSKERKKCDGHAAAE